MRNRTGPNRIVHRRHSRMIGLSPIAQSRTGHRIVHPRHSPTIGRRRTVRRLHSRVAVLSPAGVSLSGRKLLRRPSVLSPNTILLLRKRDLPRNNGRSLLP